MSEKPVNSNSDPKNEEKPEIKIETGYKARGLETQEEMDRIREEMRKENEEREENRRNSKELEDLKREWSENGGSLSEDKQNRLNELEDIVFNQKQGKETLPTEGESTPEEGQRAGYEEIMAKKLRGELLSQEEASRLREAEMMGEIDMEDEEAKAPRNREKEELLAKKERGELLSQEEASRLREIEKSEEWEKEEKKQPSSEGEPDQESEFRPEEIAEEENAKGFIFEEEATEEQSEDIKELISLIESNASEEEIKQKREELLRRYHPDNEGGDTDKFIKVNKIFDSYRKQGSASEGGPIPIGMEKGKDGFEDEQEKELQRLKNEYEEKKAKGELSESEEEAYRKNIEMLERSMGAEVSQEKNKETLEDRWKTLEEKRKKLVREKKSLQDAHKLSIQFTDEDLQEKFNKAETEYNETLADLRMAMLDEAGEGLSEEETRKKYEEILAETVSMEANRLEEAKLAVEMEEKSGSMIERTKNIGKKALNAYRKLPLRYKIGVSLALVSGAGAVSGGVLAALLGGGIMVQRALGGAALGVVAGEGYRRVHERKASKEVLKEFGEELAESIRGDQKALNEKILELQSRKGRERKKQYALGATVAFATAVLLPKAISNYLSGSEGEVITSAEGGAEGFPYEATPEGYDPAEKPGLTEEVAAATATVGAEQSSTIANIFEVKAGSSVWKTAEEYLKQNFGERFSELNEAQQTHLVDQIKDRIAEDPSRFGMDGVSNIDIVQAGQTIDFSSISGDETITGMFESSTGLSEEAMKSIVENNEAVAEWVKNNPGQSLTTERVNEIIASRVSDSGAEAVSAGGDAVQASVEGSSGAAETVKEAYDTTASSSAEVTDGEAGQETTGQFSDAGTGDASTSVEAETEDGVPEFLKEEARATAEQEGGGGTTQEFNHEIATDFQKKIEFQNRFFEAFPEESQYVPEGRIDSRAVVNALLERRITPEEYYNFLGDKITPGETFPVGKEELINNYNQYIDNYEALKKEVFNSSSKGFAWESNPLKRLEALINRDTGYIK